ncbi:hypothetical protein [Mixta calida]|uniref:hypothetical protein n=1 Tax=Mixta calida TaxID=665913 RepID=UPI0028A7B55E|nr:hypothetical protein [Mixta calida]
MIRSDMVGFRDQQGPAAPGDGNKKGKWFSVWQMQNYKVQEKLSQRINKYGIRAKIGDFVFFQVCQILRTFIYKFQKNAQAAFYLILFPCNRCNDFLFFQKEILFY